MSNLNQIYTRLQERNKNLPQNIQELKTELELCYQSRVQEAGVINQGYYSYFIPILEKYKISKIIFRYHISDEQYTDSYSGNLIKIPCVDIFTNEDLSSITRLFITPLNLFKF